MSADTEYNKIMRDVAEEYGVQSLALFGSFVRGTQNKRSDLDVLVEFEAAHIPGFNFFLIEAELSRLLGRKVDLQTLNFLGPEIRDAVLMEAVPAYEQARS